MRSVSIPAMIIEDPPHLLLWEADEMLPSLCIFSILYMWDMTLLSFLVPIAYVWAFGRLKSTTMRGYLMHASWWIGLFAMNNKFKTGLTREAHE